MAPKPLGRVMDPEVLDAEEGALASLRVDVPPEWLAKGAAVTVRVPAMLTCARCQGGGCDGCGRSGALRLEGGPADLEVRLPRASAEGVRLRIADPFGGGAIRQIHLDVRAGAASDNVRCREAEPPLARRASARAVLWAALVAAAVAWLAALLW